MGKPRKKIHGSFSDEENMSAAIREILKGNLGFSGASRRFGISKSTLFYRVQDARKRIKFLDHEEIPLQLVLKNRNVFTNEEERAIVKYLQFCSKINDGLTIDAVGEAVYRLAVCWDLKFPEGWTKNERAGKPWTHKFIKRHNDLPARKLGMAKKQELEKEGVKIQDKWKWYDISTFLEEIKDSGFTVPKCKTTNDDNLNSLDNTINQPDTQDASCSSNITLNTYKIEKSEDDQLDSTNEILIDCKIEDEDLESLHIQTDSAMDVLSPSEEPESEEDHPIASKPRSPLFSNAKRKFIIDGVCSSVSFQLSNEELREEDLVAFHSDLITYMHSYFNDVRRKK